MPESPTLLAKILSLFAMILAIGFGIAGQCLPEAMIFCGLVIVCRNLNAVQMEIFALRRAIGDEKALPISNKLVGLERKSTARH